MILTAAESGDFGPPGPVRIRSFFGPLAGPIFGYDFFASSLREFLSFCLRRFDREFLNRPVLLWALCSPRGIRRRIQKRLCIMFPKTVWYTIPGI